MCRRYEEADVRCESLSTSSPSLKNKHVPCPLQVSPGKTPQVVGALLDAEAAEDFINNLILSVRSLLPVDKVRFQS